MKKYLAPVLILLMFISLTCGYNTVQENYTPPVQKNHPRLLYPRIAQEKAFSGDIKAVVLVSKEGTVDKVDIIQPSGYNVLDNSAIRYCESLIYTPAKRNGDPVPSRVMLSLKFNLANPDFNVKEYVREVSDLYDEIENLKGSARKEAQQQVFLKHNEFVENMQDALNFNQSIKELVNQNIADEWKEEWNAWPLSFLLYHDFIRRYPDFDSLSAVRLQLKKAVQEDIDYINNSITENPAAEKQKEDTILKIKRFVEINYPDITLHDILNHTGIKTL